MTRIVDFTKMHGAGNDYIYVNTLACPIADPEAFAIKWSRYHTGIGSDGLVLIGDSKVADFSMRIFNADGSEAKMCGNASRCIGKYVYEHGLTRSDVVRLETLSGIKVLNLEVKDDHVNHVTVDMGKPVLSNKAQMATADGSMKEGAVEVDGKVFRGTFVSMGNPHFVIFVDDLKTIDIPTVGPLLEHHPIFPERVNVEFVEVQPDGVLRMRVWERGSGITMACGTGACATLVASVLNEKSGRQAIVRMDGGDLTIRWDEADGKVYMTGEAVVVFEGKIEEQE
ncbi:MAG: diaminopimelate epimerase [Paludibacteraceae bacterium]|nr:diaminopimelate epimerase [Paludibacteraceae bacterium]